VKITYTEFAPNPALRGTTTHLPGHIAQNLIAQGVAVHVPYKTFAEFMTAEHAQGSHPSNSNVPQVQGVEWSCSTLHDGRPVIWRKRTNETSRFEDEALAAHHGAPESVLKQFRDFVALLAGSLSALATVEKARREQYAREQDENTARHGVLWSRA
jgi:hypothetical protein